jgi:hypothetical protein
VSYAAQNLEAYDRADDLAVAFRLRDPITGEWRLTSSSSQANNLVSSGDWALVDVPFAANANDSYTADVMELRNSSNNDRAYSANPRQIRRLERAGYTNKGSVFTAYNEPLQGLDPIWQVISPEGQHQLASSRAERNHWVEQGWRNEGVAFYSVAFPNAALTSGWEA